VAVLVLRAWQVETMKTYGINECFYSPQGEGHRAGTMNVFLRFMACNLQCVDASKMDRPLKGNEIDAGFFCDTDFHRGVKTALDEVLALVKQTDESRAVLEKGCGWVICTGGEPTLQLDAPLVEGLHRLGYKVAIETNGTRPVPHGVDWVSCSPKPGSQVVIEYADEIRVVLRAGEEPDSHKIKSAHRFVSPAFRAVPADKIESFRGGWADLDPEALSWCLGFIKFNPLWRISVQQHKAWGVR
jgi:7-carboxy-7-deazaguanine synthase